MDELNRWARECGNKLAWSMPASGVQGGSGVDYATLDFNANKAAQLLLSLGLQSGDTVALMLPNCVEMIELMWAARRLGLYYTPISTRLLAHEVDYILADCEARVLFLSSDLPGVRFDGPRYVVGAGSTDVGASSFTSSRDSYRDYAALPDAPVGKDFVYSSGTTGRPKGVRRQLQPSLAAEQRISDWIQAFSKITERSVCMLSAPMYHAAPLRFAMRTIQHGATLLCMPKFDAELSLKNIEDFKVTHSLWVPTMFYRLLALPDATRSRHDISSLELAVHSGGPCSVDIKRRMIEWFGAVVWEYYAASEGNGATCISPQDALTHPGSVGKAVLGKLHIMGPAGEELPAGQDGEIYFEGGPAFEYYRDPEKTAQSRNALGWTAVGDIGHVDAEGFLYLSDRRAHTIVSGGINIYPAEIEDVLRSHASVADAAVFGIPNAEFGEEVKAVVEVHPGVIADAALADALMRHCRLHLSSFKCPRSVSFEARLPRSDSGKLPKGELKKRYSQAAG